MDERTISGERTMRGDMAGVLGRIDQYEILRELGEGGFGAVYLARDTVAGVEVAIKGLPPEVKHNRAEMENVRANFALVSRLHHPYIAAALHLHLAKQPRYADTTVRDRLRVMPGDTMLVMEYAPGVTLDRWRKQFPKGIVPAELAVNIAWQVAQALDFAHANHILHRDVKPANVMIETLSDGSVTARLLDFGLAAEIRSSMGRVSREIRDTSGTRPYMAPEQWAGRKQTAATDQYALAVMLHELILGEVPFASVFETGDPVIMMTVVTGRPVEIPADSPRRQAFIRALSKDGAERYPSCTDFIEDFAKSERPAKPQPSASAQPGKDAQAASLLGKIGIGRLAIAALCLVLVAAGVFTGLAVRRDRLELESLSAQITAQCKTIVTTYAKVADYRPHMQERPNRKECISRLDELYEEMMSLVPPREIAAAREQLERLGQVIGEMESGLVMLKADEEERVKEEEIKELSAQISARREAIKATYAKVADYRPHMQERPNREKCISRLDELYEETMSLVSPREIAAAREQLERVGQVVGEMKSGLEMLKADEEERLKEEKLKREQEEERKRKQEEMSQRPSKEEATQQALRCAQNGDWKGCYKQLKYADTNNYDVLYFNGVCLSTMHLDKQAGVAKNDKQAFIWFRRGARLGHAPCEQNVGEAFRQGKGVKKDLATALYWIKTSADKGNPDSVCSLAQMLEKGEGIDKDLEKAADLYALADRQGVPYATRWVQEHHAKGRYEKMVAEAKKKQIVKPSSRSNGSRPVRAPFRRTYDDDWSGRPAIGGGGGGSDAAVWGSVLGGVLTGLAIGLSAIH